MKFNFFKGWVIGVIILVIPTLGIGQNRSIDLDEAIEMARENYAGLERDRLSVSKYERLASTGVPVQPTQLFVSGEEFGPDGQTGVHSLNVQQNFYLPGVSRANRQFYKQGMVLAEKRMQITDLELKRQVKRAFYDVLYATETRSLADDILNLYVDFLAVTTMQLEAGEKGRLPQMAARARMEQARIQQEESDNYYDIALSSFNLWLQSDSLYAAQGEFFKVGSWSADTAGIIIPQLEVISAKRDMATANIERQHSQLLPQINSGLRLQNAFGEFPLFGYQFGVNLPLFRKAYRSRIEAAEIDQLVQEASLRTEEQKVQQKLNELEQRITHQGVIVEQLASVLIPLVEEQSAISLQAYREGEMGYVEYLDTLEQVTKIRQQYLEAQYEWHLLMVQWEYWTGQ